MKVLHDLHSTKGNRCNNRYAGIQGSKNLHMNRATVNIIYVQFQQVPVH